MSIQAVLCTLLRLTAAARGPFRRVCCCCRRRRCFHQEGDALTWSRRGRPGPLAGRWRVVMSTALYPIGVWEVARPSTPGGQVTLWGHCVGSKCRRSGLKRPSSEGDVSGHASLKERERGGEGGGGGLGEVRVTDTNAPHQHMQKQNHRGFNDDVLFRLCAYFRI